MGILINILVIFGLLLVARGALKSYAAEVQKNLDSRPPSDAIDPLLLPEDGSPDENPFGPVSHHQDPACTNTHHGTCDPGGHGILDAGHGSFGGHH